MHRKPHPMVSWSETRDAQVEGLGVKMCKWWVSSELGAEESLPRPLGRIHSFTNHSVLLPGRLVTPSFYTRENGCLLRGWGT